MSVFDTSEKKVIGGPVVIDGDGPVTKYRAESDGRTFWAYNGTEVFYDGERMFSALDTIERLTGERDRQYDQNVEQITQIAKLQAKVERLTGEHRIQNNCIAKQNDTIRSLQAKVEALESVVDAIKDLRYEDAVAGVKLWDEIQKLIAAKEQEKE